MRRIIIIIIVLILIDALLIEPNVIVTKELEIESDKISNAFEGIKIIHISDLHIKRSGLRENWLISTIRSREPDILIISGDFFERNEDIEDVKLFIENLKREVNVSIIATLGNWDYWSGNPEGLTKILEENGIQLLKNQNIEYGRGGDFINIIGADDPYTGQDDIEKATLWLNREKFTILIAHAPDIINHLENEKFDLILTGHTHGGQVYLPFIGAPWTPTETQYIRGMYETKNGKLYVNRGIGTSTFPVRFMSLPEVTIITLKKSY